MQLTLISGEVPWYRLLNKSQWSTLIAANLGWMFDGYETYAVVLSVGVALRELLDPSQYGQVPVYAGHDYRVDVARLGYRRPDRRSAGGLSRPQSER